VLWVLSASLARCLSWLPITSFSSLHIALQFTQLVHEARAQFDAIRPLGFRIRWGRLFYRQIRKTVERPQGWTTEKNCLAAQASRSCPLKGKQNKRRNLATLQQTFFVGKMITKQQWVIGKSQSSRSPSAGLRSFHSISVHSKLAPFAHHRKSTLGSSSQQSQPPISPRCYRICESLRGV